MHAPNSWARFQHYSKDICVRDTPSGSIEMIPCPDSQRLVCISVCDRRKSWLERRLIAPWTRVPDVILYYISFVDRHLSCQCMSCPMIRWHISTRRLFVWEKHPIMCLRDFCIRDQSQGIDRTLTELSSCPFPMETYHKLSHFAGMQLQCAWWTLWFSVFSRHVALRCGKYVALLESLFKLEIELKWKRTRRTVSRLVDIPHKL